MREQVNVEENNEPQKYIQRSYRKSARTRL
jgi:hypothetical protein